jgi:L-aspartate oxidase
MASQPFDVLVIGTGIAGLSLALRLAEHCNVGVVTKKNDTESNTNYAQGGIAAVWSEQDSYDLHVQDTLIAGAGLCDEKVVKVMVHEGPKLVEQLMEMGARFTRTKPRGPLHLGREGGHSRHRIVHAKDLTGHEVELVLARTVKNHPNIQMFDHHVAIDLITEHHQKRSAAKKSRDIHCYGAYVLDTKKRQVRMMTSRYTVLSTGGVGKVYQHTTNPSIATGDGIAMVYRAGGRIGNLEFMQFHPTMLYMPGKPSFLISEAVRGAGGILVDSRGRPFMQKYDRKRKDLAPRDIVARAIDTELKKHGVPCVYLDVSCLNPAQMKHEFPNIYKQCRAYNVNVPKDHIPVVPAAHYMCGGVVTNLRGRTSVNNLYACGEVSQTGVHGANRLASNSLLEALVFAHRSADDLLEQMATGSKKKLPAIRPWDDSDTYNADEWVLLSHDKMEIQRLMWDYVGIVRSNQRLNRAQRRIRLLAGEIEAFYKRTRVTEDLIELRNLCMVASLIIECGLTRKESRGLHFTTDYPDRDDEKVKDTILKKKFRRTSTSTKVS